MQRKPEAHRGRKDGGRYSGDRRQCQHQQEPGVGKSVQNLIGNEKGKEIDKRFDLLKFAMVL